MGEMRARTHEAEAHARACKEATSRRAFKKTAHEGACKGEMQTRFAPPSSIHADADYLNLCRCSQFRVPPNPLA
ncbi:hypothetical protein KSP40_PGU008087 [Platanthera guangdongensis]|uniref:Uncharacterized protein n=1 Tax=Platanthera guangdongensis TaxID=2320717 RepID=A0ABR2LPT8_9ASPA